MDATTAQPARARKEERAGETQADAAVPANPPFDPEAAERRPADPGAFRREANGELLVFAYGSLMWNPGFPYVAAEPALLRGYHRALCVLSYRYRGTAEKPGAVLGLDWGGSCRGMLYRIAAPACEAAMDYLWYREMPSNVYRPTAVAVHVLGSRREGHRLTANTFVARREHRQYCGHLSIEERKQLVLQGRGTAGTACDYLRQTVAHLDALGIPDRRLTQLLAELAALR